MGPVEVWDGDGDGDGVPPPPCGQTHTPVKTVPSRRTTYAGGKYVKTEVTMVDLFVIF